MVEDGLVDLDISDQGGARRHRFRASRLTGDERHGRCGMCGDQVNLAIDQLGLRGCQPQQPLQFIEKTPLTLDQSAICLTNAQGHFVSQLALSGILSAQIWRETFPAVDAQRPLLKEIAG